MSRGKCLATCITDATPHPNLSCTWSGIDITPTGACTIADGATQLANETVSQGVCLATCTSLHADHPNEACSWNGAQISPA
jgi:hypothetical protein